MTHHLNSPSRLSLQNFVPIRVGQSVAVTLESTDSNFINSNLCSIFSITTALSLKKSTFRIILLVYSKHMELFSLSEFSTLALMIAANFPLFLKFPSSNFSLATAVKIYLVLISSSIVSSSTPSSSKSSSPFSSYSFSSLISIIHLGSNSLLECNRATAGRQTRLLPHRQLLFHLLECIHLFKSPFLTSSFLQFINQK